MPKKYSNKSKKYSDSESDSDTQSEVDSDIDSEVDSDIDSEVDSDIDSEVDSEIESYNESSDRDINKKISKQIVKNDDDTDIKNIIFEKINDEYYWGKYGDFEVIMDSDGYINVTKLCSEAKTKKGGKKEFRQWKKTSEAKELMDEIAGIGRFIPAELLKTVTTGSKKQTEIRGTYAHPDLVPHIASWASTKFGARVSKIVNEYLAKEMFEKHQNLIKRKDDKIDRLSRKIDEQTKTMQKQSETMKKQDKKIKKLLSQGNEVLGYAKDTNRKINVVVNERVPVSDEPKNEESFYIVKNNDKVKKNKQVYGYKAIRITNKSKSGTMSKYYKNHPNGEIILKIKYTPNAKHLWNAYKEKIYIKDENIVKYNYYNVIIIFNLPLADKEPGNNAFCYFNLCKGYTEKQLKKDIMKIHNKRLKTDKV
nr:putative KilA-N domain-containing protein [Megavirus caiporensis]